MRLCCRGFSRRDQNQVLGRHYTQHIEPPYANATPVSGTVWEIKLPGREIEPRRYQINYSSR